MSAKPVNLRRARKHQAREETRAGADASAARHGEAKPMRSLRQAREELEVRRLEGHRREDVRDDADDRQ